MKWTQVETRDRHGVIHSWSATDRGADAEVFRTQPWKEWQWRVAPNDGQSRSGHARTLYGAKRAAEERMRRWYPPDSMFVPWDGSY